MIKMVNKATPGYVVDEREMIDHNELLKRLHDQTKVGACKILIL